jgi:trk system potassium uptake protein TrkA
MNVIIVGCGRVGSTLAYQLYEKNDQVTVIDHRSSAFDKLHPEFHGRWWKGLLMKYPQRAGIEQADALAAVTDPEPRSISLSPM